MLLKISSPQASRNQEHLQSYFTYEVEMRQSISLPESFLP
jgi:hypothetical protein